MINIAVIGCGYWGPNLIRNFITCLDTELIWICDQDKMRLEKIKKNYPTVKQTTEMYQILNDDSIDGVAIATPVHTHFSIAQACLESGKHVLIEKPLASSVAEGQDLIHFARQKGLQVMTDHTFCYTAPVRKMKTIITSGALGQLLYFDSIRINLGLFQPDINVIWDLAPHDLSILDFLLDMKPISVSAQGRCHVGNNLEDIAYVSLGYADNFIAHFHLNWLSPVKIRRTIIGGSEKMLVWDDLDLSEKVRVYEKGIEISKEDHEQRRQLLISYRTGDMYAPQLFQTEALALVVKEFADCIREDRPALTDGAAGLRVLKILEATEQSLQAKGAHVKIS